MAIERVNLNLSNRDEVSVVCKLHRSETPLISRVAVDEGTAKANACFDFDFDGENKFYPFEFPEILKALQFNTLVITGASGAGKSVFSRFFGKEEDVVWDNSKAVISNFENADDGVEKLNAVGLCSIPTWCKPRNVLSIGEGFRADLARKLKSGCVIDEFTSTVDRNVAMSCSSSIRKYIKAKGLTRCVFVSCHKDFIDVLCPDYVIDLDDECLYDTRGLVRREFELSIYERQDKRDVWDIFKKHHYLSADLNVACRMFVAYLGNEVVGMCSMLPMPGAVHNAYRIHRLVILPDYQGLGLGTKLLNIISGMYAKQGGVVFLRTTHTKLINYCKRSDKWFQSSKEGEVAQQDGCAWKVIENRFPVSFKYVGDTSDAIDYPQLNIVVKDNTRLEKAVLF